MLISSVLKMKRLYKITGFTLVEILIALVILSIGLLGLAAVQITSLKTSQASYERSIATMQARDLVERMWAGICDVYDADGNIIPGAETTITTAWAADQNPDDGSGTFAGQNWSHTLTNSTVDPDVWILSISWNGRAQGLTETTTHHFRLPPPLRPDSCP